MASFALKFTLKGCQQLPNNSEVVDIFKELVPNKRFLVVVSEPEGPLTQQYCELFDVETKTSIIQLLLHKLELIKPLTYPVLNIEPNTNYRILVSHIDTTGNLPWNFHVQLESQLSQLDELLVAISNYCTKTPAVEVIKAQEGEPIFAQYAKDSNWYRAKILTNKDGKTAQVLYVDYGNIEEVLPSATRPAIRDIVELAPAQAILCRLQSADNLEHAASQLVRLTHLKGFDLRVMQVLTSGEYLVRLFDTSTKPYRDLSFDLARQTQTTGHMNYEVALLSQYQMMQAYPPPHFQYPPGYFPGMLIYCIVMLFIGLNFCFK